MVQEILAFILDSEESPGEDDVKFLYSQPEDKIFTLDDIKAAEPLFFNRRAMRFHGTKKIYKYGNFLVVYNHKDHKHDHGGYAGYAWTLDEYVIYEFRITKDSPNGVLIKCGDTRDLASAKAMIKKQAFKHTQRDRLLGLPESVEPQVAVLTPEQAKAFGHDIGEIEEFPIKRLSIPGCHIDFEENGGALWILGVETDEGMRRQGLAKGLLQFLADYARRTDKTVYHGSYTDDGEKYLKHVVQRIWNGQEQ